MHIRRALLLFAIVLGTAAVAASLSRPAEERRAPRERAPAAASPAPVAEFDEPLGFDAALNQSRRLPAGRAATLEVTVTEPGSVRIPDLGLIANADELTPARFEILAKEPGEHEILFTPAAGDEDEPAGRLVVTSPE